MIIVKLYGGLGNQMFQYATGVALSKSLRTNLYLDLGWFEEIKNSKGATRRVYELDGLGIQPRAFSFFDRLDYRFHPPLIFKEHSLLYQPEFKALKGNVLLDGYWQSYKYFEDYRRDVLRVYNLSTSRSSVNQKLLSAIESSNSISIHVRRGDYTQKAGRSYHGLMPISYYRRAISIMRRSITKPSLFVFSDDIKWCKDNVRFGLPTAYIDNNGPNKGVDDMKLMAACRHNIIANSSFGWWAAWLNQSPGQKVIAPKKWFADAKLNSKDIIPPAWQTI